MNLKYIVGATVQLVVKVAAFALIVMYILRISTAAYDYGYRVFTEAPVSLGEGRTISVYIEDGDSAKEVGKMLEERGLIRDAKLFFVQELLSEHHGGIRSGIYDLSTSMTAQEMLAIIAQEPGTEEETGE